jgi:hypothetical protein
MTNFIFKIFSPKSVQVDPQPDLAPPPAAQPDRLPGCPRRSGKAGTLIRKLCDVLNAVQLNNSFAMYECKKTGVEA